MAVTVRSDAPTVDDARLAADALVAAGAREVWLYRQDVIDNLLKWSGRLRDHLKASGL